ncbi:MAG: hypothetical protein ACJ731_12660 [Vicinamibacterales bacterium]
MTDWRRAMRDVAECDEQDLLLPGDAQAMRQVVLAAAADGMREPAPAVWIRRPVLIATTIVAIISMGIGTGLRLDLANRSHQARPIELAAQPLIPVAPDTADIGPKNRQLQFKTAGGTRIIWVFNSDLDLKATLR